VCAACQAHRFAVVAFVFMPEHAHLLTLPETAEPDMGAFLAAVKRPCSAKVKQDLVGTGSRLLATLSVRERPGKTTFRFWQEGPGYDPNLQGEQTVLAPIEYLHENPVRRGLCGRAVDWFWSSARFHSTDPPCQDAKLPTITQLPAEFFLRAHIR
jgi:putative transposase